MSTSHGLRLHFDDYDSAVLPTVASRMAGFGRQLDSLPCSVHGRVRPVVTGEISHNLGRGSRDNRILGHVFRDGATCSNDRLFPYRQPGEDGGTGSNRGPGF